MEYDFCLLFETNIVEVFSVVQRKIKKALWLDQGVKQQDALTIDEDNLVILFSETYFFRGKRRNTEQKFLYTRYASFIILLFIYDI